MGEEDEVGNALNDDEERLSLNKTTRMNGDDIEDEQQQNEQLNDEILNEPPLKKRRNDETAKIMKERGFDYFYEGVMEKGNEDDKKMLLGFMDLVKRFNR